ncbi:hypothetical protein [Haloarchaeobius amylolyticus]|nr:hypothetical protein [Haloarchaeobius amylolyticus]
MKQQESKCKLVYCTNGWVEIKELGKKDAWIATDTPVPILE